MTKLLLRSGTLIIMMCTQSYGQALPPHEFTRDGQAYKRAELIVQFSKNVTDQQIQEVFRQGKLSLKRHVRTAAMEDEGSVGLTHTVTDLPTLAAADLLQRLPGIDFVEPNWIVKPDYEANDPLYLNGALWNMCGDDSLLPAGPAGTTNPFGSQAEQAWAAGYVGSDTVFIGNIDSGFEFSHPDLAANVWSNPGEIPGNGIDDDNNGYIDDVHGWNSMDNNGTTYDLNDVPNEVHGTATAGVAGAVGGNAIGVAGVSWNVKIIAGKFLPTGATLDAIEAVDYMVSLKTKKGLNIVALNNSWSGNAYSQALQDAFTRAANAGILSTCSAGNLSTDNDALPRYPASLNTSAGAGYDAIISVAATDRDGNLAAFSCFGRNTVDLGAPGADITTTVPGGYSGGKNGTSYAAPQVAGAIALYAASHPAATASETRQNLLTYGLRSTASLSGKTVTGGRLDTYAFVTLPAASPVPPSAPSNVRAQVVSGGRIDLNWLDLANNELGFAIERSLDGQLFALLDTVGVNLTAYSDRTVRPATSYTYRVRAFNPGTSSEYVYLNAIVTTPAIPAPSAPAGLTASAQAPGKGGGIALAWTDTSSNEDGFRIERKIGTSGSWAVLVTLAANANRYTDPAVASKTTYFYRVQAFNAGGNSAYSNQVNATPK